MIRTAAALGKPPGIALYLVVPLLQELPRDAVRKGGSLHQPLRGPKYAEDIQHMPLKVVVIVNVKAGTSLLVLPYQSIIGAVMHCHFGVLLSCRLVAGEWRQPCSMVPEGFEERFGRFLLGSFTGCYSDGCHTQ